MTLSEDRPPIDPYPLSPYVAWAGRRNRGPILDAFKTLFPGSGDVLELATGSGQHINFFAPNFSGASVPAVRLRYGCLPDDPPESGRRR